MQDHHLFRDQPDRMHAEIALMREFTRATLTVTADGELAWIEELRSTASGRQFRLVVTYPASFPYVAPKVFIPSPDTVGAPHRFLDGALCLFGDHVRGSGQRTTALSCRNRGIAWFLVFEVWERTGEWLGQT